MNAFLRKFSHLTPILGVVLGATCMAALPAAAQHAATSQVSSRELYDRIGHTFWDAEDQLRLRVKPFSAEPSPYKNPLTRDDALYQKYFYVNKAAGEYLQIIDTANPHSWTVPPVLYLGGIAAFTIGDYANAQKYFSRLLDQYPQYQRNLYINDRYAPDPDFAQPVKPAVTKLLFYCQNVNRGIGINRGDNINRGHGVPAVEIIPEHSSSHGTEAVATNDALATKEVLAAKDAFATFQQFNQSATKVLLSQAAYANWLAHRPYQSQRRRFFNEDYGDDWPDQCRASLLPKMPQMISNGWEIFFPAALKKSGSLKMRAYLRGLTKEDAPLKDIAAPRLVEVDELVIKYYFARAKVLLRKHQFDATRKMYRRIIAEYPDSAAASRAEAELPRVVPVAVKFYKTEGDKNFHPEKQFGVPQTKARAFFEKMYKEDSENESAEYALYYWARALGTEGKVKQEVKLLQQHLEQFPESQMRVKAMYLLAFTYGNNPLAQHDKAIAIYRNIVALYPDSEEASESLWQIAFLEGVNSRYDKAIVACQMLISQYPQSYRYEVAKKWEGRYQQLLRSGKKWPG